MRSRFQTYLPPFVGLLVALLLPGCAEDEGNRTGTSGADSDTGTRPDGGTGALDSGPTSGDQDVGDEGLEEPDGEGQPGGGCAGTLAANVLEEVALKLLADAEWTALNTHGQERGYALSLLGTDLVSVGSAFLIETCGQAIDYDPYCEPDPEIGVDRCLRMGCEEEDIGYAEVYFTDGSTSDPTDRHPISYESSLYGGTVTYDPNPYRYWRADQRQEATVGVECDVDHRITLAPVAGSAIDASHAGTVALSAADFEVTDLSLELDFANLSADDDRPIHVSIARAQDGYAGSVTRSGETLATVSFGEGDSHDDGDGDGDTPRLSGPPAAASDRVAEKPTVQQVRRRF